MDKAIFISGGAGRVLAAIPVLEKYVEKNPGAIIVSEAWPELYLASPPLREVSYVMNTKGLFTDKLLNRKIVSLEPYRVNEYYNQKCNLTQAFDIELNQLSEVPEHTPLKLDLSKQTQVFGYSYVEEMKKLKGKDKAIVYQPFGSTAQVQGRFIIDSSGRSFELKDVLRTIEELNKEAVVIMMSSLFIPTDKDLGFVGPNPQEPFDLLQWAGIINAADHVLACDSVAQHLAAGINKSATVVIGATFPENISYPDNPNFHIMDLGKGRRKYSPLRILQEAAYDLNNEDLMIMSDKQFKDMIDHVKKEIK